MFSSKNWKPIVFSSYNQNPRVPVDVDKRMRLRGMLVSSLPPCHPPFPTLFKLIGSERGQVAAKVVRAGVHLLLPV